VIDDQQKVGPKQQSLWFCQCQQIDNPPMLGLQMKARLNDNEAQR
jgi:hypothetical protein